VKGRYSLEFLEVLYKLVEYFPKDRYGYLDLKDKLDTHYSRQLMPINTKQLEFSSAETATIEVQPLKVEAKGSP
jgi:hypothetical protein